MSPDVAQSLMSILVLAAIGALVAVGVYNLPHAWEYELISYEGKWLTVRKHRPGQSETVKFYGSSTVWHEPDGTRCPTMLEARLSELWTLAEIRDQESEVS